MQKGKEVIPGTGEEMPFLLGGVKGTSDGDGSKTVVKEDSSKANIRNLHTGGQDTLVDIPVKDTTKGVHFQAMEKSHDVILKGG